MAKKEIDLEKIDKRLKEIDELNKRVKKYLDDNRKKSQEVKQEEIEKE